MYLKLLGSICILEFVGLSGDEFVRFEFMFDENLVFWVVLF